MFPLIIKDQKNRIRITYSRRHNFYLLMLLVYACRGEDNLFSSLNIVEGTSERDTLDLTKEENTGKNAIKARGGNDIIIGSAKEDFIWAGEGRDIINAKEGNDLIVILGSNIDEFGYQIKDVGILKGLLSKSELNSYGERNDVNKGDNINGGVGNDNLIIYGKVDLSKLTINNLEILTLYGELIARSLDLNKFAIIEGKEQSKLILKDDLNLDAFLESKTIKGLKIINLNNNFLIAKKLKGQEFLKSLKLAGKGTLDLRGEDLTKANYYAILSNYEERAEIETLLLSKENKQKFLCS